MELTQEYDSKSNSTTLPDSSRTILKVIKLLEAIETQSDDDKSQLAEPITDEILIPPDGGWGWAICAAAFDSNFLIDGVVYASGYFKQAIEVNYSKNNVPVSPVMVAWVFSLITSCYQLVGPFVSVVSTKISFRAAAIIGGTVCSISLGLGGLVCYFVRPNNIAILYVTGIMTGCAMGFVSVPAVFVVGFYFKRRRALATSIAMTGSGLGSIILQPIVKLTIEEVGWELGLCVFGGAIALTIVAAMAYKPVKLVPIKVPQVLLTERTYSNFCQRYSTWSYKDEMEATPVRTVSLMDEPHEPPATTPIEAEIPVTPGILIAETDKVEVRIIHLDQIQEPTAIASESPIADSDNQYQKTILPENSEEQPVQQAPSEPNKVQGTVFVGDPEVVQKPIFQEDIFNMFNTNDSTAQAQPTAPTAEEAPRSETELSVKVESEIESQVESEPDQVPESLLVEEQVTEQTEPQLQVVIELKHPTKKKNFLANLRFVTHFSVIRKIFNSQLLLQIKFVLVAIANFAIAMVMLIPYLYIQDAVQELKLNEDLVTWYLLTLGLCNTFARLLSGALCDCSFINPTILTCAMCLISAGSIAAVPWAPSQAVLYILGGLTGTSFGALVCMKPILLTALFGIDKLTNAFGLLSLISGFGYLLGLPIADIIKTKFSSKSVFVVGGAFLMLPLVALLPIYFWTRKPGDKNRTLSSISG